MRAARVVVFEFPKVHYGCLDRIQRVRHSNPPMTAKIVAPLLVSLVALLLTHCGETEPPSEPEPAEPPETVAAPPAAEPEPEPEAKAEPEPAPPPEPTGPQKVRMVTNKGEMLLELYPERAPDTVANFLQYVDERFYDGTIFHRVIPRFMIQGGGFTPNMREKSTREPVKNEAGSLSNLRYTIAMARTAAPHSATAQFFINHVTNRGLDKDQARDGWGYCVFGKVIEGSEVVESIAGVATGTKAGHSNVPVAPIVIESVRREG